MKARSRPLIKGFPPKVRRFFGGARGTRTWRVLGAPAQAQDASGEDGRDLAAALVRRHVGGVAGRVVGNGRESFGRS